MSETEALLLGLAEIDAKIEEHQNMLAVLRARREAAIQGAGGPYREIAACLHATECSYNHTDGCGWFYENDWDKRPTAGMTTWTGHAHKRWLEKAVERVVDSGVSAEEFLAAVRIVAKR